MIAARPVRGEADRSWPAPGALTGLRVVELGRGIAVPYCSWLLAALGADVIKVEPPGGDSLRWEGPRSPSGSSGLFDYLNANKRCVTADLATAHGRGLVADLASDAALLIEDFGPGGLERFGLAAQQLTEANDGLALVRLSPFGQDGPISDVPASELTLQAMAGWVKPRTTSGSKPVMVGGRLGEYVIGVYTAAAALVAVRQARGGAVLADVSGMEALHCAFPPPTLYQQTLRLRGSGDVAAQHRPLDVARCRDGWVGINILTAQQWADVCVLLEVEEYSGSWAELKQGGPLLSAFRERTGSWLERRTVDDIIDVCQALRIPAVPVGSGASMPGFPQWRERAYFSRSAAADQAFLHPGFPWRLSGTPASFRSLAPRAATATSTTWLPSPQRTSGFEPSSAGPRSLPLEGIRVLDLASFWAGSYVTCFFGAMGADVVKVESIQRPDGFRYGKTFRELGPDWYEMSGPWRATNLNKRDVTLDLRTDEGKSLLRRLVTGADLLVENYSARVVESFGLGYEGVRQMNERCVMARLPGFGLSGPWRDFVGWGNAFEQLSGLAWVTGHENGPPATPGGYVDPVVGMHAVVASLAALWGRDNDAMGRGQLVEVPQIEVAACMAAGQVIDYSLTGELPTRHANRSSIAAPQGVYQTTDRRWIALTVRDDDDWSRLAPMIAFLLPRAIGCLATAQGRLAHLSALDDALSSWAGSRSLAEAVSQLRDAELPVAAVAVVDEYLQHPQLAHRRYWEPVDHPVTGLELYPGWPFRLSRGHLKHHRRPAPLLGQHNAEILSAELGLPAEDLQRLAYSQIIGNEPLGLQE